MQDVVATMPAWWTVWALPIGVGVCLSAACGFRTFVPLLGIGLASHFGLFPVDAEYAWLGSTAGLVALATAALLEVGGYYVPIVDHVLDVIATPLAVGAGALAMATSIGVDHGIPGWILALLVGGSVSGAVQLTTVKARAISTGTTAGLANPLVATAELVSATTLSVIALLVPVLAVVVAAVTLVLIWLAVRWLRRRRMARTV